MNEIHPQTQEPQAHLPSTIFTKKPARKKRIIKTVAYVLLAFAGIAAGLLTYFLIMMGQPLRTNIDIVEPDSLTTISLDEIQLKEEGSDIVSWDQGGRTRVYVHPDFPIKKVAQKDPDIETILVFGVDSRGASDIACRADSLILVTIDKKTKSIKLTSIMRDTQVKIAGRTQPNRINAAYAFGGVGLLINTLNETFDLDIQRFAMFDFWSAASLIDSVGGVEINVKTEELHYLNIGVAEQNALVKSAKQSPYVTKAGLQLLDGQQAIAWARIRKLDSDAARAGRQRTVMMTLLSKFSKADAFSLISLINKCLGSFETNMRNSDMIRLGMNAMPLAGTFKEYRIPEEGMYKVNPDPWMMIVNWDKQVPALHDFIWGQS
jgi:polyisoprenyl-teichoic acid--peptidoglycan teichoic acid transferase